MRLQAWLQYGFFLLLLTLLVKPLGGYMARVFQRQRTFLDPLLTPLERLLYRLTFVDQRKEMNWQQYAWSFVLFGFCGTLLLYAILRMQRFLPWFYPAYQTTPLTPELATNTAISFSTTTTWQAYSGETTMSYFSQMIGLTAQNFLAGASGLAVGMAFLRSFARQRTVKLGNFWVDLVRALLWVLLPLSLAGALLLVWQGVPMNFHPYTQAKTMEGPIQTIAQGPVAALEIIKNLGTNGGGFFNANGAHPYENPTPLTNLIALLAIAALPAAFTNTFGRMVGNPRQGWTLYAVMTVLFVAGLAICDHSEQKGNRILGETAHLQMGPTARQPGGNMEGKEVRFGIAQSVLTAVVTSNGATGSYNSMHDSYSAIGGAVPLVNMLLGETVYGGLGTGLYSMVMVVLLALLVAGLMVGRTPEYLGKTIGPSEARMLMLYVLASPLAILPLAALAVATKTGLAGLTTNTGPHGLTEIIYAFASATANNGQSFAGLNAGTPFYNLSTAVAMMVGRFGLAIPALALAGMFAAQRYRYSGEGAIRTDSFIFGTLLLATTVVVCGLSFLPVLTLGPVLEHLMR
ncbi:MAG TPA: potassium-transporting ATPase subunit KdpA [Candidatus Bathyarchaeia archaeon]|nr:potassium-transporting ATPase subunit KdpA [Candidatus Bathyarchaeia archaeon]